MPSTKVPLPVNPGKGLGFLGVDYLQLLCGELLC